MNAVDVHPFVNGGAYWVDGFGTNIFTQGRNGIVKHFVLERRRRTNDKGVDNDGDDEEEEEEDDDDQLLDFKYLRTVNDDDDSGFCACHLSIAENEKDRLLAIPKSDGRVSLRSALLGKDDLDPSKVDFKPDASLKLGMCMVLAFASSSTNRGRVLVGYEDGSLVLWDSSTASSIPSPSSSALSSSSPSPLIITVPLCRLKIFGDSTPVLSLDFLSGLGLGFAGSTGDKLCKFQLDCGGNSGALIPSPDVSAVSADSKSDSSPSTLTDSCSTSSSSLSLIPHLIELGFEGVSSIRLRVSPDFPKLLVVGGWDSGVRLFTFKTKLLAVLHLHKKTIRSIDFDPVSGMMAVGSDDSHVSLWRLYCEKKEKRQK